MLRWKSGIFVCSKARAGALRIFDESGILNSFTEDEVVLFVEPQEYDAYSKEYGNYAVIEKLAVNDKGLGYARHYMQRYAEQTNTVAAWFIDDDIKAIYGRTEKSEKGYWKMAKLSSYEVKDVLLTLSEKMVSNRWCQLGLSFKASNYLVDSPYSTESRNCAVVCNNIPMLRRHKCHYDPEQVFYNDYLFACDAITLGLRSARSYEYAFDTPLMNALDGGCKVLRSDASTKAACQRIIEKYGSRFVSMFFHEAHGVYEVKIKWAALRKHIAAVSVNKWW